MFSALILVCSIESGYITQNCIELNDEWGPYNTEENCIIRLKQIEKEFLNDPIFNFYIFSQLSFPDSVGMKRQCKKDNSIDA